MREESGAPAAGAALKPRPRTCSTTAGARDPRPPRRKLSARDRGGLLVAPRTFRVPAACGHPILALSCISTKVDKGDRPFNSLLFTGTPNTRPSLRRTCARMWRAPIDAPRRCPVSWQLAKPAGWMRFWVLADTQYSLQPAGLQDRGVSGCSRTPNTRSNLTECKVEAFLGVFDYPILDLTCNSASQRRFWVCSSTQ